MPAAGSWPRIPAVLGRAAVTFWGWKSLPGPKGLWGGGGGRADSVFSLRHLPVSMKFDAESAAVWS